MYCLLQNSTNPAIHMRLLLILLLAGIAGCDFVSDISSNDISAPYPIRVYNATNPGVSVNFIIAWSSPSGSEQTTVAAPQNQERLVQLSDVIFDSVVRFNAQNTNGMTLVSIGVQFERLNDFIGNNTSAPEYIVISGNRNAGFQLTPMSREEFLLEQ